MLNRMYHKKTHEEAIKWTVVQTTLLGLSRTVEKSSN